jgi:carbamoylphosphate synthase large subunit
MKFAVVAHRQSETNVALAGAAASVCRHPCCPRATRSVFSSRATSRWGGSTCAKSSTESRPAPELPVVLKPRFGSWGRDVALCRTPADVESTLDELARRSWFREHRVLAQ